MSSKPSSFQALTTLSSGSGAFDGEQHFVHSSQQGTIKPPNGHLTGRQLLLDPSNWINEPEYRFAGGIYCWDANNFRNATAKRPSESSSASSTYLAAPVKSATIVSVVVTDPTGPTTSTVTATSSSALPITDIADIASSVPVGSNYRGNNAPSRVRCGHPINFGGIPPYVLSCAYLEFFPDLAGRADPFIGDDAICQFYGYSGLCITVERRQLFAIAVHVPAIE
ncbi:hypothetical protein H2203_003652 [Taxawa tesnikishii (nom. ined.)]|nr:hypothetical protein H2203_003652 [Dothideales sp. JES 119]